MAAIPATENRGGVAPPNPRDPLFRVAHRGVAVRWPRTSGNRKPACASDNLKPTAHQDPDDDQL